MDNQSSTLIQIRQLARQSPNRFGEAQHGEKELQKALHYQKQKGMNNVNKSGGSVEYNIDDTSQDLGTRYPPHFAMV